MAPAAQRTQDAWTLAEGGTRRGGAMLAPYSIARGDGSGAPNAGTHAPGMIDFPRLYHALTSWHFEGRDARNGPAPSDEELKDPQNGWKLLPKSMSIYHDNGVGAKEDKYINPDGRESVRDGDTGEEVIDPRYKGTYNYVNPMDWNDVHGIGGVARWALRNAGHIAADVLPYKLGGNVRGPG